MTPKEKASQLVKRFYRDSDLLVEDLSFIQAKECALIAVDEILHSRPIITDSQVEYQYNYWQEVKQEIENYDQLHH
jgi:hypothetical protein